MNRRRFVGAWLAVLLALLLALGGSLAVQAQAPARQIWLLDVEGVINPFTAQYVERELRAAAGADVEAVVIRLDTPGGLESSMREIAQAMLGSPIPVIVYVTPEGARAASAGMFVTMAAHVAAMAPGTNIGAAHPVGIGGQTDEVMTSKVVNDAAALARGIAERRGRNAAWAEQAVRESVSITASEAVTQNVIDLVAEDLPTLLARVDGRRLMTPTGEETLETAGAELVERPMTFAERILHVVTNPNVAYVLSTVGVIGIMAELYSPGALFPGIIGAISLLLAFVAFGSLPVSWAGAILLLLGIGLLLAELNSDGVGILAAGGLIAFVLGSLMLYQPIGPVSPAMPTVAVSPWVIGVMAAILAGFVLVVLRSVWRARKAPAASGRQALVGRHGVAATALAPRGTVRLEGEEWTAVADVGAIPAGDAVEVVDVEGVILTVRRLDVAPAARSAA